MSLTARGSSDPGALDRRVRLQYPVTSRDAAGGAVVTWFEAGSVWAAKRALSGARLFAAQAKQFSAELVYRIRHRIDVAAGWRLIHGDDVYEITALAELGRAHLLELELRGVDQSPGSSVRGFMLHGPAPFLLHGSNGYFVLHSE